MLLEWAVAGAVILAGLIFCLRIMRRGITTLEQDRDQYLERIRAGELQLREDRKNISLEEQCRVLRAAVEDLLRLAGNPPGHELSGDGPRLLLRTPTGEWRLELNMRERSLRTTRKVPHGRSRWLLSGGGHEESFDDLADLMRSLNARLRGDETTPTGLEHLARRLSRRR
ncbi:translation initiation factor IF-2 [Desulfovibrio sp. SGI.169]|uniref:translation initiation factor IF-2 n=1 Tax=Desulfovibrio sp. SGI.169 TaxID=3420561 RepID=UPI003CFF4B7D